MGWVRYWRVRLSGYQYLMGLAVGCVIALGHLVSTIPGLLSMIDGNEYLFTPYTQWLAARTDAWTVAFYFCLPLICALGAGQTVGEDVRSGFLWQIVPMLSRRKYVTQSIVSSFIGGAITAMVPLVLDFAVLSCFLPNITPDAVMNAELGMTSAFTFLTPVFFSHPLLWVGFYVGFVGVIGGEYAMLASTVALFRKDRFSPLGMGFMGTMVLSVMNATLIPVAISPVLFSMGVSPVYLPPLMVIVGVLVVCLVVLVGVFDWGVARHVTA